ncbi:hypothetical protein Tco_0324724 [Tanacetum coccineum]
MKVRMKEKNSSGSDKKELTLDNDENLTETDTVTLQVRKVRENRNMAKINQTKHHESEEAVEAPLNQWRNINFQGKYPTLTQTKEGVDDGEIVEDSID